MNDIHIFILNTLIENDKKGADQSRRLRVH